MAPTKLLARGWTFELNTTGSTWVRVKGINTWSHSPTANDADATDFDSEGHMEHSKASRGDAFTLSGYLLEDEADGTRDPGQEAVEAWGREIGPASIKNFRITSPGGNIKEFGASATVTYGGGGNDDNSAWSVTITVSGDITDTPPTP